MEPSRTTDLLEEHLEGPLETTIFTPRSFRVEIQPFPKSGTTRTHVEIKAAETEYLFDMFVHDGFAISANGRLFVPSYHRKRGIGTALVTLRETICEDAGVERILINENHYDDWWRKRGYEVAQQVRYYRALAAAGIIRYDEREFGRPREKLL